MDLEKLKDYIMRLMAAHQRGSNSALDEFSKGYHQAGQVTCQQILNQLVNESILRLRTWG